MYKVKMFCFEGETYYEDEPAYNPACYEREEAMAQAMKIAEDECDLLNGDSSDGVRFAVVKDEAKGLIHVNYYNNGTDTGTVTTYYVEEISPPTAVEVFGFTHTHANADKRAQEIESSSAVFTSREAAEDAAWAAYTREFCFAREYGLLQPSEKKCRKPAFVRGLWAGTSCIRRIDLQVRFGGWSQILKIGG